MSCREPVFAAREGLTICQKGHILSYHETGRQTLDLATWRDPDSPTFAGGEDRIDEDAIVILEVFAKKTRATPRSVIETCRRRLKEYDDA